MRLIDADKIIYDIDEEGRAFVLAKDIDLQPTVDAEPIRRGHWEENEGYSDKIEGHIVYECSECGELYYWFDVPEHKYCRHCGAKMDEWEWEEPEINPCRGCEDYDGRGGCKSNGGCGAKMKVVTE